MFQIKICGITTADDALLAAAAGADAIGLNFYEKSPRYVHADQAGEIVQRLREDYSSTQVQVFGVFVNATLDDILWTIREANLYAPEQGFGIQLHGDEPPELLAELKQHGLGHTGHLLQVTGHVPEVPILRAFRIRGDNLSQESDYLKKCQQLGCLPQAVLIDAYDPTSYGGTGQRVDWSALRGIGAPLLNLPFVLAGGLNPTNVAEAIRLAHPAAIDVASGVESTPGRKNPYKVRAFVTAAKAAFARLDSGR